MICQEGLTQKGFFFSPGCTSVAAFIRSMISTSAFQCLAMLCLLGCMMVLYNFLDLYFPTGNWRIVKFRKSTPRFRDIPPFLQGCERTVFWRPSGRRHVFEPFLDGLFASLYAFPGIVEYHEV